MTTGRFLFHTLNDSQIETLRFSGASRGKIRDTVLRRLSTSNFSKTRSYLDRGLQLAENAENQIDREMIEIEELQYLQMRSSLS